MTEMELLPELTPDDHEQELQNFLADRANWRENFDKQDSEDDDLLIHRLSMIGQAIEAIRSN